MINKASACLDGEAYYFENKKTRAAFAKSPAAYRRH